MKIKLTATAFSNITYNLEEIFEDEYMTKEDWDEMSESEQDDYLNEQIQQFVWDDIDVGTEIIW